MKIFLTGATGYLGSYLIEELAEKADKLFILVRSKSYNKLFKKYGCNSKIELVVGDISNPDVIDETFALEQICSEVDSIVHAAAFYDLQGDYAACFMDNVVGTQNILYLAKNCLKLKYFHYVSTIAIAGSFKGPVMESELELGQKFSNHYAKTKYDAECLVRQWSLPKVKKRIYRLGILIGNSKSGEIYKVDGPYYFFQALSKFKKQLPYIQKLGFLTMPINKNSFFPIIPVDHAANYLIEGIQNPKGEDLTKTYHVISEQCPTVGEFLDDMLKTYNLDIQVIALPKNRLNRYILEAVSLPRELLGYLYATATFDQNNLARDFTNVDKSLYVDYKEAIFLFAKNNY